MDMDDELTQLSTAVAALLRDGSRQFVLPRFKALSTDQIATKSSDTDYVTIADEEMEAYLTQRLPSVLADTQVLGEEAVSANPALRAKIADGRVFVVDPVDGTRNFVQQKSAFCSMVSLLEEGAAVASWIYEPLADICSFAARHKGCWQAEGDGAWQAITRPATTRSFDALIGTGGVLGLAEAEKERVRARLKLIKGRRFVGSAGIETLLLLRGEHDFLFHSRTTPWDHSPVDLFAREMGMQVATVPDMTAFNPMRNHPILAAPDAASWQKLRDHIWLEA